MTAAKRSPWRRAERRCDMRPRLALRTKCGFLYASLMLVTRQGRTLEDIKNDPESVAPFARSLCEFVAAFLGPNLASGGWCICTTPRRRHAEGLHFATEVCRAASAMIGIPFREDVATARTRARIDAEISLVADPPERNVILYDDVITTGITMRETRKALMNAGHTVFAVAAIRNGE